MKLVFVLLLLLAVCAWGTSVRAEYDNQLDASAHSESDSSLVMAELTDGLQAESESEVPTHADSLLESRAETSRRRQRSRRRGWGIGDKKRRRAQQRLPSPRLTGAASTLTRSNVRCVLCQYLMQRIHIDMTAEQGAASSFLEISNADDQQRITALVEADATAAADAAWQTAQKHPEVFNHGPVPSNRFRKTDVLEHRPDRARFAQIRSLSLEERTAARQAYLKLYSGVYASFETLCTKKMPLAYLPYCNDMLKSYRFFAQGINYGDRPESICMNGNFCDRRSYVRHVPHNAYIREPGDA